MKSVTPLKAIWLMYFSTSSAVMPMPRSLTVRVFFLGSSFTSMERSPSSPLNSPRVLSVFSFCVASTALLMSSRRKISWSE